MKGLLSWPRSCDTKCQEQQCSCGRRFCNFCHAVKSFFLWNAPKIKGVVGPYFVNLHGAVIWVSAARTSARKEAARWLRKRPSDRILRKTWGAHMGHLLKSTTTTPTERGQWILSGSIEAVEEKDASLSVLLRETACTVFAETSVAPWPRVFSLTNPKETLNAIIQIFAKLIFSALQSLFRFQFSCKTWIEKSTCHRKLTNLYRRELVIAPFISGNAPSRSHSRCLYTTFLSSTSLHAVLNKFVYHPNQTLLISKCNWLIKVLFPFGTR